MPRGVVDIGIPPVRVPPSNLVLTEKVDSREWTESNRQFTVIRKYFLTGTPYEEFVRSKVLLDTPTLWHNLIRDEINLDPVMVDEKTNTGHWDITIRYVDIDSSSVSQDLPKYSFDTTGGTQHVTQSIFTVASYAPPGKVPGNHKGAIRVTKDRVEGVDIPSGTYQFNETHVFPASTITNDFKGNLFQLRGRMNDSFFKGFKRGECLFLGAVGSQRGVGIWEVNFRFAGSPNIVDRQIGDILVREKLGWDYLWVEYAESVDKESHSAVKTPVSAHVERVIDFGNFNLLQIGSI